MLLVILYSQVLSGILVSGDRVILFVCVFSLSIFLREVKCKFIVVYKKNKKRNEPLDFTEVGPLNKLLMSFVTTSFLSFCFFGFFPLESLLRPLPLEVEGILKSIEASGVSTKKPTCNCYQRVPCTNFLPTRYTIVLTFYLKPLSSSYIHRLSMGSQGYPA